MIIVKLISGLGNQLFQYTIGRQLSIQRRTPLKLDISFYETQSLRNYKLNHYNIQAEIASDTEIAQFKDLYRSHSAYAKIFRKTESFLPKRKRLYFREDDWWLYDKELLRASSHVYIDGYWQHYKYYTAIHPRVLQELTVKDQYIKALSPYLTGIQNDLSSVSVHIRRGDYLSDTDTKNLFGVLPLQYYDQAIGYITEKISSPSFYIFSDDLDWAKDNLKIPAPVTFVEMEDAGKDYLELSLMSRCRHNIIANSTFSWWGAFLNRHPGKIVVAPARWCIPEETNRKIEVQFPSWIKI